MKSSQMQLGIITKETDKRNKSYVTHVVNVLGLDVPSVVVVVVVADCQMACPAEMY